MKNFQIARDRDEESVWQKDLSANLWNRLQGASDEGMT